MTTPDDGWASPGGPSRVPPPRPSGPPAGPPAAPATPAAPVPQPTPARSQPRAPAAPPGAPPVPPADAWNPAPYYAPGWQAPVPEHAPPPRRSRGRALVWVGAVAAVLLLAAGVVGVRTWMQTRPLGEVAGPVDAHPGRLQAGHCLAELPEDGAVDGVRVVPCDTAHVAEVVGRLELPDGAWPGRDSVTSRITTWCDMDSAQADAGFEPVVWVPTERGWGRGDRVGMCLAWLPEGTATGSFTAGDQVSVG